ncbi:MAG: bifunctional diaminohydroxyphosphoribosylaminopyrimidine deaminase/5-amino-6-(5-phosphoribosylamino)uracil reductase RibD, partial [Gemmatimonadales bacterium]
MHDRDLEREAMRRALELARRGWGRVAPNPLVGAVVLRDGTVVGEGYHAEFGGPHAEVVALDAAGDRARGGTLVVTLEPCAHQGKTPPCTGAIVAAGLRRVVAAVRDPEPRAGGGLDLLRREGVDVEHGVLAAEAAAQN